MRLEKSPFCNLLPYSSLFPAPIFEVAVASLIGYIVRDHFVALLRHLLGIICGLANPFVYGHFSPVFCLRFCVFSLHSLVCTISPGVCGDFCGVQHFTIHLEKYEAVAGGCYMTTDRHLAARAISWWILSNWLPTGSFLTLSSAPGGLSSKGEKRM